MPFGGHPGKEAPCASRGRRRGLERKPSARRGRRRGVNTSRHVSHAHRPAPLSPLTTRSSPPAPQSGSPSRSGGRSTGTSRSPPGCRPPSTPAQWLVGCLLGVCFEFVWRCLAYGIVWCSGGVARCYCVIWWSEVHIYEGFSLLNCLVLFGVAWCLFGAVWSSSSCLALHRGGSRGAKFASHLSGEGVERRRCESEWPLQTRSSLALPEQPSPNLEPCSLTLPHGDLREMPSTPAKLRAVATSPPRATQKPRASN